MAELAWDLYISQETKQWLLQCHPQSDVMVDIYSRFVDRFQKTRALGPLYGKDPNSPIKHLRDLDDLWEARVHHSTGSYRLFFRFVRIEKREAGAFGGAGVVKKGDLSRSTYEVVSRRVNEYLAALAADPKLRQADLMK